MKKKLSMPSLVMLNVGAICCIKNWAVMAELGPLALFFIGAVVLFFFLPIALVSAELATGWPQSGGVYAWVKEALGHRVGFLAMWYLWMTNLPWYPTLLSFIASAIAFSFNPALAENKIYIFGASQTLFWLATLLNLRGMSVSCCISALGVVFGTFLPGCLIIVIGAFCFYLGQPSVLSFLYHSNWIPDLSSLWPFTLLAGILFSFSGIEMSAIHAPDVVNPQKNYPKAIFLSTFLIVVLSSLGTLAIAALVPQEELSPISGGLEAFSRFFTAYGMEKVAPWVFLLIALGAFGQMNTWIAGPSRGLVEAANQKDLPLLLCRKNQSGMPAGMMIVQAIIVSLLSFLFLYLPSLSGSFWLMIILTTQFYLLLYVLMFIAAIRLRIKKPEVHRSFRVPGGLIGIGIVAGIGIGSSALGFFLCFIPPPQVGEESLFFYETLLAGGMVVASAAPSLVAFFTQRGFAAKPRLDPK